jgi:SAM-dependent methyltransferase
MSYQQQVEKKHYSFSRYFFPGRWMSYYYQTKEIAERSDIKSVLDIGPGTDFLKHTLSIHRNDITYKTLDIAEDLHPDYKGSVTEIPLPDASYDAVCAFQVLEHIQFEDFEKALSELNRVSRKYVFISLPHFGPSFEFWFKIPFVRRIKWATKLWFPKEHTFDGQHYWEIGKKGYSSSKVRSTITKHFSIINEYVPFENQYHHFYILEKKK